ncbi:MAG: pentapeptide repeat-containing protein [Bacteroidaceae bacterium]|nr:pentapeptide repeat-containing protein [Bacteroidaceae bacterium]
MVTKIQIKSTDGNLLFEHEAENNSIKKTVEAAVKNGVKLVGADLSHANLSSANLTGVVLHNANLRGANLSFADLNNAYLVNANFCKADLRSANLRGSMLGYAKFSGANLDEAILVGVNMHEVNLGGACIGEWGELYDGTSDILIVGPLGRRKGYTTIYHTEKGLFVQCGCFHGSMEQFELAVKEIHGNSKHARDYQLLIDFARKKYHIKEEADNEMRKWNKFLRILLASLVTVLLLQVVLIMQLMK